MKKTKRLFWLALAGFLAGCGSGDDTPSLKSDLKILASNVVFASEASADSTVRSLSGVDETTQVLASNVVVDDSQLRISATDVQTAFDEIVPDLATFIEGTWSALSYQSAPYTADSLGYGRAPGVVTFHADGTFTVDEGTLALLRECDETGCTRTAGNWHIEEGSLLAFDTAEETGDLYIYTWPVNYSRDKITLLQGDNIAILSKIQ